MVTVYHYDEWLNRVEVVSVFDARSAQSPLF